MTSRPPEHSDVVIVGGGHNGLVAAALLARAGLRVVLLAARVLGGAARTEAPFPPAPGLRQSTALSSADVDALRGGGVGGVSLVNLGALMA